MIDCAPGVPAGTSDTCAAETRRSGTAPARDHLPALTGLRFVLAVWVIVHHLTGKGRMLDAFVSSLPDAVRTFVESGYVAVGTFFVLSGFVLARSYANTSWNRKTLIRYAVARYARVYPVYLLSLVIVSPIIFSQLFTSPQVADNRAEIVTQYGLVLQGWSDRLHVHWNTPAWSLSCELFFYLCFPLAVVLMRNLRWRTVAVVVAAAFLMPSTLRSMGVPEAWKPLIHFADFLVGIGSARLYGALANLPSFRERGYWLYVPAAIAGSVLIAHPNALLPALTLNGALRPLNALLLIGLALGGGHPWRALATPSAIYLGRASYSMYILHIPLLWWYKRTWFYISGAISTTASAMIYVAAVVVISAVVWKRVEEPANNAIRKWAASRLTPA